MHPPPHWFAALLLASFGLVGTATSASAARHPKLDKMLQSVRGRRAVHRVILQTLPERRAGIAHALQAHGDTVLAEYPSLNSIAVLLHDRDLRALENDASIVSISADAEVRALSTEHRWDSRGSEVLRETLGLSTTPFSGSGVNVAVVDSGIDTTRDLRFNIDGFWDFTRGGLQTRPRDDFGHGTQVAGLIASGGESKKELVGVAPAATLYGFKVLDKEGRGVTSNVVDALEFIVANKLSADPGSFKIDIINLSLGHPIYESAVTDPLVRAVEHAVRAGIVVVTAAGNIGLNAKGESGYAGITSPGNAPSAITVGAVDTNNTVTVADDSVAVFSSRGPTWFDGFAKPDVVAPGVALTFDATQTSSHLKGVKGNFNGTSMAAAVATGVASLVLEASRSVNQDGPELSPNAVKGIFQFTAFPLRNSDDQVYDALTQGTGEVNAQGAVVLAVAINTAMPVGSPWLRTSPEPLTVIGGELVSWSSALNWNDSVVSGTDVLAFHSAMWDDNIVWGTAFGDDESIVWGTGAQLDNIVWGTSVVWAGDLVWSDRIIGVMADENIVWGTVQGLSQDNIVWGTFDGDNIVWGTWDADSIVWGTVLAGESIVWGTASASDENIVWGTAAGIGR